MEAEVVGEGGEEEVEVSIKWYIIEMHTLSSSSIHMFLNDTKLNILLLN